MDRTTCCIVGGGPAGMALALLLARRSIPVVLLEAQRDFDRDFRGNTINPAALEILDELGLAERLLRFKHARIERFAVESAGRTTVFANFTRLRTRYPFVLMLPQVVFLEFIAAELRRYPHARLLLGARVAELIIEQGRVCGVRYQDERGLHELRALLTVGADGRFSRVRRLAGLAAATRRPPIDVLWFRLERKPEETPEAAALFRFGRGALVVLMEHFAEWQVGYIIPKGGYRALRAAGLEALRSSVAEIVPAFADRVGQLREWRQVALLPVAADRLRRWHRPGLLLIGDAAHVTSPVGGVGINLAIQDAVAAANILGNRLRAGLLVDRDLAAVQRRRELPVRVVQLFQRIVENWAVAPALRTRRPFALPVAIRLLLRLPLLRDVPAALIAYGAQRSHVEDPTTIEAAKAQR